MATLYRPEYVTFSSSGALDEVDSHTYGWKAVDYTAFRRRTRVGESRPIPGSPGRMWVDREWDEHTAIVTWKINGFFDPDGTPYGDPFEGVDLNHNIILDNIVNALDLRSIVFHDRQSVDWDGAVGIENWEPSVDPNSEAHLIAPMTLKIPAGYFVESGS